MKYLLISLIIICIVTERSTAQYVKYNVTDLIQGEVGKTIAIDIRIDSLSNIDMYYLEAEFIYDKSLIQINTEDVIAGELLQNGFFEKAITDNTIRVAFATTTAIKNVGDLLAIKGILLQNGENKNGFQINKMTISEDQYSQNLSYPHSIPVQVGNVTSIETGTQTVNKFVTLYPNPFNSSTNITFKLERSSYINMDLYSSIGKKIRSIYSGQLPQGSIQVPLNMDGMISGVYFVRINAAEVHRVVPFTLVK